MAQDVPLEAVVSADVAVVLLAGLVVVRLSRRLRQPPVVGEIATGILLGPSVLGLLPGDLPERLFPGDARPMLSAVAQVGLLLFMFLAGWELDLGRLRGRARSVGVMATFSMTVPFLLGIAVAVPLFDRYGGPDTSRVLFVCYLGTAFAITAFPVLARIIKDSGLSETAVGTVAMACAAVGDVVGWCVLVLLVAGSGGGGAGEFAWTVAATAVFGLVMAFLVRPGLRVLLHGKLAASFTGTLPVVVASGVFLSAWATSWIGVHAIFGAFAFGLVMPRDALGGGSAEAAGVVSAFEKIVPLLLPVFFIVTGLSVDVGALGGHEALVLVLVLTTAVVGKYAGAVLSARACRMPWREATAFGTLMNTRGLTELVVLDIGRQTGVIDGRLFTMMVVMALVTTAMAGPLLHLLGVRGPGPAEGPAAPAGPPPLPAQAPRGKRKSATAAR